MADAELQWIGPYRRSQLVHEAFVCQDVCHASGGTQMRRTQRRVFQPMSDDAQIGNDIGRLGVLLNLAARFARRLVQTGGFGRQQRDVGQALGALRHPGLAVPRDDLAAGIERAAQLEHLRRRLGVPAMLVLAHPLHAYRPAEILRQQRGFDRGILVAVHAVAA